ncbi:MAG: MATE family efflux transporter [Marinovum sp.]|nr:MATE family efflux transporter [Marinovum sp.]
MGHVLRMTLAGTAGITFMFLVDAANLFWISQLGDIQLLAAIGFAFAIQFFSISFGLGLMIAATAIVSKSIGQNQYDLARQQASSAMILAFLVQALVAFLIVIYRQKFVALSGAEGETAVLTERYLLMTLPTLPIMAIGLVGGAILRSEGDALRAMLVTMISGGIAMLIDPILIITLDLKLDGAASALWISRLTMAGLALWFVIGKHNLMARPTFKQLGATSGIFFAISIPVILTQLASPVANYLLTKVISDFGDSAVAAWAVINRLTVVAFGGIFSLSGAVGGIFGQNYGAQQYDRLRSTYRDAIIFCACYTALAWALLMLVSDLISDVFGLDPTGASILWTFTHIGAAAFIFTGLMFVVSAAFTNMGKPVWSTALNWFRDGLLTLPAALWLSGIFAASGVIYAQGLVALIAGILATVWGFRFIKTAQQSQSAVDPNA